jgi:hypothetical protein
VDCSPLGEFGDLFCELPDAQEHLFDCRHVDLGEAIEEESAETPALLVVAVDPGTDRPGNGRGGRGEESAVARLVRKRLVEPL